MQQITLIIASKGRPRELGNWLQHLQRQSVRPQHVIFSVCTTADVPDSVLAAVDAKEVQAIYGEPGLCAQRNRGLTAVPSDTDILLFFDDDYVPAANCVERIVSLFNANRDIAGCTGLLLADGIHGESVSDEDAAKLISAYEASPARTEAFEFRPGEAIYGCNMAYRYSVVRDLKFDENLPLYGWQEDVDFANRVRRLGLVGRTDAFVGVHQGVKGGRTSGRKLGYSQVANPIYLLRKGTLPLQDAATLIGRNFARNHTRSIRPEPLIDRRGRAVGNWIGIWHLLSGRLHPLKALEF